MTNPHNLTGIAAILYEELTNPTPHHIPITTILDREQVHWTATHGPRRPEVAEHILATPHLLQLLRDLWNETPPTPELTAHLQTTPHGQALLTATQQPQPTTDTKANTPAGDTIQLPDIPTDQLDTFFFELDIHLLTTTETTTASAYRGQSDTDPTITIDQASHPATNHPDLAITTRHTTNPTTGEPHLNVTINRPGLLTQTGHTTWTATATLTHQDGTTTTHTSPPVTITPIGQTTFTIPLPPNTTPHTTITTITIDQASHPATSPQNTPPFEITDQTVEDLLTDIYFVLLGENTHALRSGDGDPATAPDSWEFIAAATSDRAEIQLQARVHHDASTGQTHLLLTTLDIDTLLATGHHTWTLTYTHTDPTTSHTTTHTNTQGPIDPFTTHYLTFDIPTTTPPDDTTRVTLTPVPTTPPEKPRH